MIQITSYLHREALYDLIRRWMVDDLRPDDGQRITGLVHFNNVFVSRYLNRLSTRLFAGLHAREPQVIPVRHKADLKDAIVQNTPYENPRIAQLVQEYRAYPERYYRETPFHGSLFFVPANGGRRYVGANRIKRVRRLAEKTARRIIDRIFEAIKRQAESLADDRARRLGIPRQNLLTGPEDMLAEFLLAERRILDDLKNKRPLPDGRGMVIEDVAGVKVLLENGQHARVREALERAPDCEIVEVEPHAGRYNATNIIVRHTPDKERILAQPIGEAMLRLMAARGLPPDQAQRDFAEFVRSGEAGVHIEVIVSNYQEMMESEIGRCMHEDRIIEQRLRQEYRGHLAKNIEYLMEYLFASAVSNQVDIRELPIKLWNRYLPDYYDEVIKALFAIPPIHLAEP
jgi:hypothetical protein